jgi:cytochrome c
MHKKLRLIFLVLLVLSAVAGAWMVLSDGQRTAPLPTIKASGEKIDASPDKAAIERGRHQTRECGVCHTFDEGGPARLGPNLFGIVGSPHAHMKGYPYSKFLSEHHDRIWTPEALDKWLQSPTAYAPDTKMQTPGILDANERADIIAYLKTLK